MSRHKIALLLTLCLIALFALPAFAQDETPEATEGMMPPPPENAIVSGLNNPRGVAYDADGNLYVTEAGAAGSQLVMSGEEGDTYVGLTSQVIKVAADGTSMPVVPFLASFGSPDTEIIGAMRAYPQGGSIWVVLNGAGTNYPPLYADAILEVDMASGRIKNFIDLYAYEAANNPDGNDIDSNVGDLAWVPDGTLYIVEVGANTLYTWSAADGLQVVHVWSDNPVPDSIAFASDGSFYIGFLGAGLAPGAAKVEHWSADGSELLDTFAGLTTVTDVTVGADDNVYAVQLLQFGEQGPMPNSGSLVLVNADGATTIADGLNFPYAAAQAPDGSWAVSVNATFAPPGSGAVVTVGGM